MTINSTAITLTINGRQVQAEPGNTILSAARKASIYIPTLCFDPDLQPAGACRLCVVEIEGRRGLHTSCTTTVAPGMVVYTETAAIYKLRRGIIELILSDHPTDCLICPKNGQCTLQGIAARLGITDRRFKRLDKPLVKDTSNPFFDRDLSKCILCGICVRTCKEVVGIAAVDFIGRGFESRIGTVFDRPLAQSNCTSCGECMARCPTGALHVKQSHGLPSRNVNTVCSYCGCGCGLTFQLQGDEIIGVKGIPGHPASQGELCVKGRFGHSWINHPDRLREPLIKKNGQFIKATWDEALDLVAERFATNVGHFSAMASARCTNEENYIVQKFTRVVMGTNNVDNSART